MTLTWYSLHTFTFNGLVQVFQLKGGGVKLVLAQTSPEIMRSCKCFPHMKKMLIIAYNWTNSVITKTGIILIIIHLYNRGRGGRDRMVVGFITTYAISAYLQ
jgi:hypothetical protein